MGDDARRYDLVLPDGSLAFGFNLGDPLIKGVTYRNILFGPRSTPLTTVLSGRVHIVGASFHPGCGFPFINHPLSEFVDDTVSLDLVLPEWTRITSEAIARARTTAERFHVMDLTLTKLLCKGDYSFEPVAIDAVRSIIDAKGFGRIEGLADSLGIGKRRLERQFAKYMGLRPKLAARMFRFHKAVDLLLYKPENNWASAVVQLGYCDQAHLIRDFREFSGKTPSDLFGEFPLMADKFLIK